MKHVVITAPFPSQLVDKIRGASDRIKVEQVKLTDGRWPKDRETEAEIFYALSGVPGPHLAPNLKWVQTHAAGIDHLVDTPVWHSDILITSASGIHTSNMAQYVMAQLLTWANRVQEWLHHQQSGRWPTRRWEKYLPVEIRGQTMGILGYGSVGREVARLAKAFGMRVLVTKRNVRHPADRGYTLPGTGDPEGILPDRIYPGEATRSMLAECDYVVITLPLTKRTYHLLDESVFKEMKPNSFLVNISRGRVINEEDLVKALRKGWLAGAGLDVFEEEPLPEDSPLWQMDNVVLTPHVSGFTDAYDERVTQLFIVNLKRYLDGDPLLNLVDRDAGY